MNYIQKYRIVVLLSLALILYMNSCKKEVTPTLTTDAVTNQTGTTATGGGKITDEGSGTVIKRGVCWSTARMPTLEDSKTSDGSGVGTFTSTLTGLTGATVYWVRAYATNSAGTGYGLALPFATMGEIASAITQPATNVSPTFATLNGMVNANYLSTAVTFEYGPTIYYGSSVSASQSPVSGYLITNVSANISGLTKETIYHYRVKTINSLGTSYGNDLTIPLSVADVDNNVYVTTTIGTQVWMKENLKTTRYRNGDIIGTTTPATLDITGESTPKYQWAYDGDESNVAIYGRLYTWYTVNDSRNVCPDGWHVPDDSEWTTLTTFLGGENIAGGKLKESGKGHWLIPDIPYRPDLPDMNGTNETGFTALPGGYFAYNGSFGGVGTYGNWWSSSEESTTRAWHRTMYSFGNSVDRDLNGHVKSMGFSLRCLKDN